jgi:hypothetical protein
MDKYLKHHGTLTEELAATCVVSILDTLARIARIWNLSSGH